MSFCYNYHTGKTVQDLLLSVSQSQEGGHPELRIVSVLFDHNTSHFVAIVEERLESEVKS